jgi:hypothetical protein
MTRKRTLREQKDRMVRNAGVHQYFTEELSRARERGLKKRAAHVAATEATARHFGVSKATNAKSRQRAVQRIRTAWSEQEQQLRDLDSVLISLDWRLIRQVISWFSRAELDSHAKSTLPELALLTIPRAAARVDELQRQVNDLKNLNDQLENKLKKCQIDRTVKAAGLAVYSKQQKR